MPITPKRVETHIEHAQPLAHRAPLQSSATLSISTMQYFAANPANEEAGRPKTFVVTDSFGSMLRAGAPWLGWTGTGSGEDPHQVDANNLEALTAFIALVEAENGLSAVTHGLSAEQISAFWLAITDLCRSEINHW